jgi:hypothetical protein
LKSENPTETAVPPPAAALSSRDRLLIWSCLAVVIALAWA